MIRRTITRLAVFPLFWGFLAGEDCRTMAGMRWDTWAETASALGSSGPVDPSEQSKQRTAASGLSAKEWFAKGQNALQAGDLNGAEAAFRKVLAADPHAGAAYANLGVIAMRRGQWDHALALLQKAEKLEPKMIGIRLNIGLVKYRSGDYAGAIAPLASVVKAQPESQQARYLLGLCNVFTEHYAEAVATLEPLWPQMSNDTMYLYVLDIAAHSAGQNELDEKALQRLVEIGSETPEFHLILGKAYLNREEPGNAIAEFEKAAAGNATLPLVHFDLGVSYMRSGGNQRAEAEFRKDMEMEPDLADNYEQLGVLYSRLQKEDEAEKMFREALRRDPKMAASFFGLAKLYLQQQKYPRAMEAIDAAVQLAPNSQSVHYLRGQILKRVGRAREAQEELLTAQKMLDSGLNKDRQALGENRVPNPELKEMPVPQR